MAVAGEVPLHGLEVFGMLFEITNASWDFEIVGHVGDGTIRSVLWALRRATRWRRTSPHSFRSREVCMTE